MTPLQNKFWSGTGSDGSPHMGKLTNHAVRIRRLWQVADCMKAQWAVMLSGHPPACTCSEQGSLHIASKTLQHAHTACSEVLIICTSMKPCIVQQISAQHVQLNASLNTMGHSTKPCFLQHHLYVKLFPPCDKGFRRYLRAMRPLSCQPCLLCFDSLLLGLCWIQDHFLRDFCL